MKMLSPYLNFDGNCREAMEWYRSIFGGELSLQTFAEAKIEASPKYAQKIMHAALRSDSIMFMASDAAPDAQVTFGNAVHMSISGDESDTLTTYFEKLSEGGRVTMPLEKQFWGDQFGMLIDRFGIHWMINIRDTAPQM